MNAPMRPSEVEAFDRGKAAEAFEEIGRLAWAVSVHAEVIEKYAVLGHVEGVGLAVKDCRACLVALINLTKELRDA